MAWFTLFVWRFGEYQYLRGKSRNPTRGGTRTSLSSAGAPFDVKRQKKWISIGNEYLQKI